MSAKDATHVIREVVVRKRVPNGDDTYETKKEDVEIYPYQAYKILNGYDNTVDNTFYMITMA